MSDVIFQKVKLGDLGYTYPGLSGKSKEDFGSGKPYIPYLNIFTNAKIKKSFLEYVDIKPSDKQNKVQKGDLFFTTSSETVEEVGMTSVLLDEIGEAYLNSFCFGFRLYNFNVLLPEFAAYLFRSEEVRKKISLFGQGSTRYNLPKTQLFDKLYLNIPVKYRQQKIYDILTTCDTVIEQTQAAIEKYKAIKQGMLHDLFTRGLTANGQLRPTPQQAHELYKQSELGLIPKEWEVKRLEEIGEVVTGSTPPTLSIENYGDQYQFISPADINGQQYILKTDKMLSETGFSISRHIPANSICIVCIGSTIGKSALTIVECCTNQQINSIIPNDTETAQFYYYATKEYLSKQFAANMGLQAVPIVNKSTFQQFVIPIPSNIREAILIQNRLISIDTKLQSEEVLLSKYQSIKKGLMSDLLSGKREV